MAKMSINAFMKVAKILPKNISILLRGETGIGKSQLIRELATKDWGFKDEQIIDRRLAQLSEGDVIGLPSTDGNVTRFNPPDWYKRACDSPMCLFLDEINRASPEVMQAAFQIVLDRELNGWKLHPDTRVCSAINVGSDYVVNEMDPALLRRFWTVDLDPTTKDWITWAKQHDINETIINFIEANEQYLHPGKNSDSSEVQPVGASWERLHNTAKECKLFNEDGYINPKNITFRSMCLGFIGYDATAAFIDYIKMIELSLSPESILSEYKENRTKIVSKLSKARWSSLIETVGAYCRSSTTKIDKDSIENLKMFIADAPIELRGAFMSQLCGGENIQNENLSNDVIPKIAFIWNELKQVFLESFDVNLDTDFVENKVEVVKPKAKKSK